MGTPKKDFSDTNNDAPKSILILPIDTAHIGEIMGLHALSHTGAHYLPDKSYFKSYIGSGLVAVEPKSKDHPQGRAVGYALLGKNPVFRKSLCLNNIFVLNNEPKREEYLEQLVRNAARVCMEKGLDRMSIMVAPGDDTAARICAVNAAEKSDSFRSGDIAADFYTISDLPGKFGHGADKKEQAPQP